MTKPNISYKESGTANPINIFLSITSSLIVLLFVSFFYSFIITYLPLIYFNFIVVAAYGFIIAYISRGFNTLYKIRNKKTSIYITIVVTLFAIYFQWVNYLFIISYEDIEPLLFFKEIKVFSEFLFRPDLVVIDIINISKIGFWSLGFMSDVPVKGIFLWLIWLAEIAIISFFAISVFINFKTIPFSERDNKWYKKEIIDFDFEYVAFKKQFIESFLNNASESILSLKRGDGIRHSKISIFSSKGEPNSLISLDNIIVTQRGKGKKDITKVIEHYYIDNKDLELLKQSFRTKKSSIFDY